MTVTRSAALAMTATGALLTGCSEARSPGALEFVSVDSAGVRAVEVHGSPEAADVFSLGSEPEHTISGAFGPGEELFLFGVSEIPGAFHRPMMAGQSVAPNYESQVSSG